MAKNHPVARMPKFNANEDYQKNHVGNFSFDGLYLPIGAVTDRDVKLLRAIAESSTLRSLLYCFGVKDYIHLTIAEFNVLIHCRERFSKFEVYYTL